LQLEIQ